MYGCSSVRWLIMKRSSMDEWCVSGRYGGRGEGENRGETTVQSAMRQLVAAQVILRPVRGLRCTQRMHCSASQMVIVIHTSHPFSWHHQVGLDEC